MVGHIRRNKNFLRCKTRSHETYFVDIRIDIFMFLKTENKIEEFLFCCNTYYFKQEVWKALSSQTAFESPLEVLFWEVRTSYEFTQTSWCLEYVIIQSSLEQVKYLKVF